MPNSKYILDDLLYGIGKTTPDTAKGGLQSLLANRFDLEARGAYTWLMDACLEFSRNFRFQWLETTGPLFYTTAGQYSYDLNNFILLQDAGKIANIIPSLYRYFLPFTPIPGTSMPGNNLLWKTIDALELMFHTPGIPQYFTRYGSQIYMAPVPNASYPIYLRYQVEHPFSNPPVGDDKFLLDNDWREIVELGAAERGAIILRMMDYASQYHTVLFGDPEFERSSGARGNPGLIFRRISQMEGDSESMMKSIRPMVAVL